LLVCLLRQDPRFQAVVSGLSNALQGDMSGRNDYPVFIANTQRRRILQGLFRSDDANALDTRVRATGLRTVRKKIAARTNQRPAANVFRHFKSDAFWRDTQLTLRGVRVV
jgi:hypothetical protein